MSKGQGTVQNEAGQPPNHGQRASKRFGVALVAIAILLTASADGAATLPSITAQPQSRAVNAGASVSFAVAAVGDGPLSYEWWNESGPLYPPRTDATLELPSAHPGDAGAYRVRVRNGAGTVTSAAATLNVTATRMDNVLQARTAGGTGADPGSNLDTDSAGNVYAVGSFSGTATFGTFVLNSAGGGDVFVVKYGPDGNVLWARRAGGGGDDAGAGVTVDRMGNLHLTGAFSGTADFGGLTLQSSGGKDAFVVAYDRDGNALWARGLGGNAGDAGHRIACDSAGNSYVIGAFSGSAAFRSSVFNSGGGTDVFLAKFSASGFPLWMKRFGGPAADRATGLTLDAAGNVFVTGTFTDTAEFGGISLSSGGVEQVFLIKCDRAGSVLWAKKSLGLDTAIGTSIVADENGSVFLTGAFSGTASFGATTLTARQGGDHFVAKYGGAGTVEWAACDGRVSKLGFQPSEPDIISGFGSGTLDWSGGGAQGVNLLVGRYPDPALATWARQAGAGGAPFSFGLVTDGAGKRFLAGFLENPDGTVNLEGDSLTIVPLAETVGMEPPLITLAPQGLSVNAGASATFGVTATGGGLGYQWRYNGADISGANAGSYTLVNAQAANAGRYSVVVFNGDGSATSTEATLAVQTVVEPPPPPPGGPVAVITSPVNGARFTNTSVMVFGSASGSATIARVEAQVNAGATFNASGTTSWFAFASLQPGTNVFRARAVDTAGNTGDWATREFILGASTPPPPQTAVLTVTVSGNGRVTPDLNGQSLTVGSSYTLTAVADAGHRFTGWTGSLPSANASLTFVMQSGLSLRANFTASTNTNPPPPPVMTNALVLTRASYNGLFSETDAVRHYSAGAFALSVSVGGSYSGSMRPGGRAVSFSGRFTPAGAATNRLTLNTTNVLYVTMQLASSNGVDHVAGSVRTTTWESPLWAARAATGSSTNPVPFAGRYTLALGGGEDASVSPGGHGSGTLIVDAAGKASLTATLGDGTAITRAAAMSAQGFWPFYVPLYSEKGSAAAWVTFADRTTDDFSGEVDWSCPPVSSRKRYPAGFAVRTTLVGSRYVKPSTITSRILNLDYSVADLAGGNLLAPFHNNLYLSPTNKVLNLSSNRFSLSFTLASGTFTGATTEPGTGRSVSFKGAVLQKGNAGVGHFLGTNQTGRIEFGQ